MYGLDYDDLRQRHKLRRQKRIINISIITAIACFIFALYSSLMLIKINSQQEVLKHHQALSLASKSEEHLKKDDRYEAIKTAYQSLVEFEGVKMPYTPEAEYALSESLGIYDIGASYKSVSELKTKGIVDFIKSSENNKYAAIYDESGELTLFDTSELNIISTYTVSDLYFNENFFSFVGNDFLAFVNKDKKISLVKTENGELFTEIETEGSGYAVVKGNGTGEYLVYSDYKNVYIYDVKENKKIGNVSGQNDFLSKLYFSEDSNYVFAASLKENYDIYAEDSLTVYIIDIKEAKEVNTITLTASSISGVATKNNNAYILLNNRVGVNLNILLVSYNITNGNINWTKDIDSAWGDYILRSYAENTNDIAVVNQDQVFILDADNGEIVNTFNTSSSILKIYTFVSDETYLTISSDGSVNYMDVANKNNYEYAGRFELKLDEYIDVEKSENGLILIPQNENRIILYEEKANKDMKLEDIQIDFPSNDSVSSTEQKQLIEDYNMQNKNLVNNIFYDTDKKVMFVNYKNNDIAIYNTENKELIKLLNNVGTLSHYFGKDKNNRIYIGDVSNTYILDKNYNKVGYIKSLRKLEDDKLLIANNGKIYSLKIYSLNEMLEQAKQYLK